MSKVKAGIKWGAVAPAYKAAAAAGTVVALIAATGAPGSGTDRCDRWPLRRERPAPLSFEMTNR